MLAVSRIGAGTVLVPVSNGAPASFHGVPTSAVYKKQSYPNTLYAIPVLIGLRPKENGSTVQRSHRKE